MSAKVPSIEQLQELGLPAPVSYWPQTWGWWALLGLLALALLVLSARAWLHWRRTAYRREALAQLRALEQQEDLRALPELLKRVALSMPLPPEEQHRVPTLSGADWQTFLLRHGGPQVPTDFSQQLADLAYGAPAALSREQRTQLLAQCKAWVEHHHVAA